MSREALIVVDMLKGFLEHGYPLFCGEDSRRIIPKIIQLLQQKSSEGAAVLYVCDQHAEKDPEFSMYPAHCVRGTEEAEIIGELSLFPGTIIHKTTLSGFYQTDLDQHLQELSPQRIFVVGVCTDICVQYIVADLRIRGYETIVPEDCVATFNPEGHRYAMLYMERVLGANVVWAT